VTVPPDTETLRDLVDRGYPVDEIAEACGRSVATVYRWLRESGIGPPSRRDGARTERVQAYLTPAELAELAGAAETRSLSVSEEARRRIVSGGGS